jgi:hypothetical protein
MQPKQTSVLIIDNDLGSVFWLGHVLEAAGYDAFPARSLSDANLLLKELCVWVDLLIVRASIPGVAAFLGELRANQGIVRTLGLLEETEELKELAFPMNAWFRKPLFTDETAQLDYLDVISQVLSVSAWDLGTRTSVG